MAVQRNADGSIDKRTKEGKAMLERMAKARAAAAKAKKASSSKPAAKSTVKKTQSGTVDKRTKEGKEICARMAKARAAQNSLVNRLKRLFR